MKVIKKVFFDFAFTLFFFFILRFFSSSFFALQKMIKSSKAKNDKKQ
jgi:CHASE3 domain sensor protein